jgi:cell division protein FtsZ
MENPIDYDAFEPRTIVAGVGGQGSNLVNRLFNSGIKSASTVAINTDLAHLNIIHAHKKLLIGKDLTRGLGAGGFAEVAAKCAQADRSKIESALEGNNLVFVCAGMGGGTGTGAAPVVAEVASKMGATVIAVVTFPFALERSRKINAEAGINELSKYADSVMVIENDLLLSYVPNLQMEKALEVVDNITGDAVKNIADAITLPSLINLDYADLRSVVARTGTALISIGLGTGTDKVERVIKSTKAHPLLTADIEGAKSALVHVIGGNDVTIADATRIGEGVTESMADNANVIFGARVIPELRDQIRVMSVITGVKAKFGQKHDSEEARTAALRVDGLEAMY